MTAHLFQGGRAKMAQKTRAKRAYWSVTSLSTCGSEHQLPSQMRSH